MSGATEVVVIEVIGLTTHNEQAVLRLGMRAMYCETRKTWKMLGAPSVGRPLDIPLISVRPTDRGRHGAFTVHVCLASARREGLKSSHLYIRTDPHNGLVRMAGRYAQAPTTISFPNFAELRAMALASA